MRNRLSQKEFVKNHLIKYGKISRNYCLQSYISRLGALILILRKDGFPVGEAHYVKTEKGMDYVYYMKPPKSWEISTANGIVVKKTPIW